MEGITGITVSYNTEVLLKQSVESIRKFYPYFNIIIIDGSPVRSRCWTQAGLMKDDHTAVVQTGINIGHGNGMHAGFEMITTEKALIFDTDIIMFRPCLEMMLEKFKKGTYGVGFIIKELRMSKWTRPMRYLHPFFAIIDVKQYWNHERFVHHGAPCHRTFDKMSLNGAKKKLVEFPVKNFVEHLGRGTRNQKPKEFQKGWVK